MEDEGKVATTTGVAIIGIGCRLPGGVIDVDGFWDLLRKGVDAIVEVPPDRYDVERFFDPDPSVPGRTYVREGGYTSSIDQFDAAFFGISPREAAHLDPQQRMLLEVTYEALEDAGLPLEHLAGTPTGVFVAICSNDYGTLQMQPQNRQLIDAYSNIGTATNMAANRISYYFDFRGPSLIVDTACSSSLSAIHLACSSLRSGESAVAVVAGVQVLLTPEATIGFSKATMLSPTSRSRAFDAGADGYVRGEGCVSVILKPLDRALQDGDPVYAVIRGTATNCDGRTNGITVPSREGQEAAMREAYAVAGIEPARVAYIEAHGTGTPVGDPIEAASIGSVVGEGRPAGDRVLLGSVKTNIGHLEAASGMAGVVKAALVLRHRMVPPSLHFDAPNPSIPFDQLGLQVVTDLQPLARNGERLVAGVNSFGFGGTNGHIVLEEAPPPSEEDRAPAVPAAAGGAQVLALSARQPGALAGLADAYRRLLMQASDAEAREICAAAALRRSHHEYRLAVVGSDGPQLADQLGGYLAGDVVADVVAGRAAPGPAPSLVFVFSGMGPQWWGMGRQLMAEEPVFRATLEAVEARLRGVATWSLMEELARDEATTRVNEAELAQPTNFAIQAALFDLWRSWGVRPDVIVGHSAGEIAGTYAAGILSLEDAALVAFHRGRLQNRATGKGRMLFATISEAEAEQIAATTDGAVAVAAINGPNSVTLSGDAGLLEGIEKQVAGRGLFCRLLPVDVPYHSRAMDPIEHELIDVLSGIKPQLGATRMVSTCDLVDLAGPEVDATYWWRSLRQPVRFAAVIGALAEEGHDTFLEIGPHPVLALPLAECLAGVEKEGLVLPSLRRETDEAISMRRSLGALHASGVGVDWSAIFAGSRGRIPLPTYPWQHERHWFEGNSESTMQMAGDAASDPVLGGRVRTPRPTWEAPLGDPRLGFLDSHLLDGVPVYPGAGYVAAALAAVRELNPEAPWAVRDMAFSKAMFTAERDSGLVQLAMDPSRGSFQVSSVSGKDAPWTVHATGRMADPIAGGNARADAESGVAEDLDQARQRCLTAVDPVELYRELAGRGLGYGPEFQGILEAWRGEGEALATVGFPESAAVPDAAFTVHPALLDAALQVLIVGADTHPALAGDTALYVPVAIDRVTLWSPLPSRFTVHAVVTGAGTGSVTGYVRIYTPDGRLVLDVRGIECQAIGGQAGRDGTGSWLYRMEWRPVAPARRPGEGPPMVVPADLLAASQARVTELAAEAGWPRYYHAVEPELDALAAGHIVAAFRELGWEPAAGDRFTSDELAERIGVSQQHRLLFGRLLEFASDWGALRPEGSGWVVTGVLGLTDKTAAAPTAAAVTERFPEYESVTGLVERCGAHLADVLRGTLEPQKLLFADAGLAEMARFYTDAPPMLTYNMAVREALAAHVANHPEGVPLRILELGAGTGGTTAAILPLMPADRCQYTFTDVSPAFLGPAKERFADHTFVDYRRLDVEAPPESQGFGGAEFDVVIAANVMHATSDLRTALENARRLLAPGGLLVALEITRRPTWLDLVFGLTEGWWKFGDFDIRPNHALLDAETWPGVLEQAGFEEPVILSDGVGNGVPAQSVLLARRPATTVPDAVAVGQNWLILGDGGGVGDALAAELEARGGQCTVARPGAGASRKSESRLELRLGATDDLSWALQEASPDGDGVGVIHMWSLDMPDGQGATAEDLMRAQELGPGTAAATVRALEARPGGGRLWLVTSGAQPVEPEEAVSVVQAPLWGLGRVIVQENADLGVTMIDLPAGAGAELGGALAAELYRPEREEEIAVRHGATFARRLERVQLADASVPVSADAGDGGFRLEIDQPGSLESLTLRRRQRRAPGRGEVEIEVRAAALNFRDVMFAMGMLPAAATDGTYGGQALGFDCAGVVTACGEGVEALTVGDAVVGIAPAAFGSYAVTAAALLMHKPATTSFDEAATLPTAFATAVYALDRLARLREGETLLIHSATGGVGLAALQVARRAGARIFATAGTEEKRNHLRGLGITEVMDSRSLDFTDRVMEATDGRGVDVILNSLSGEAIPAGLAVMAPYGRFVELGKRDIYADSQVGLMAFRKNLSFFALDIDRLCAERPQEVSELLHDIVDEVETGHFESLPTNVFSIEDAESGFRVMAQAKHVGKVVLTVGREAGRAAVAARDFELRPDATYVVTGGLGGFGLEVARWMAEAGAQHLALLGRSTRPEADAAIEAIRGLGTDVHVLAIDVSDEVALAATLTEIRGSMPPIRGVVHAAMVLDDCPLVELDTARMRTAMAPKMMGAWNLHRLTADDPLELFVLFSSIATLFGNPLQGNYSAGNAFLDALARHRRGLGLVATAVNWGVLSGTGYVSAHPEIGRYLERQGYLSFTPAQALRALEGVIRSGIDSVAVARIDWQRWSASAPAAAAGTPRLSSLVPRTGAARGENGTDGSALLAELAAAAADERLGLLAVHIQGLVARVLGTGPDKVDPTRSFTDIGLDSLMAVELMTALKRDTGVEVPVMHLLEGVSAEQLAAQLVTHLGALPTMPHTASSQASMAAPVRADSGNDGPAVIPLPVVAAVRGSELPPPGFRGLAGGAAADAGGADLAPERWPLVVRVARALLRLFFAVVARVEVEGLEHVPTAGAVVIVGNHLSFFDAPLLLTVLSRRTTLFAGEFLRRVPVVAGVLRASGAIFVERGEGDVSALEAGLAVLASGGALGIAPEGIRSSSGGLRHGFTGAAYLAGVTSAPLLPVVAFGQELISHDSRRLRRPRVRIRFGPVLPSAPGTSGLELVKHTEFIMETLAALLPEGYRGEFAEQYESKTGT